MLSVLTNLAQYSSYSYEYSTETSAAGAGIALAFIFGMLLFGLAIYLFLGFTMMKIFQKAGYKNAWAGFVPIYNTYVLYEISGRPGWWVFLSLIPFVGGLIALVTSIIALIDLAKSFGKDGGYAVLLILLPIVGFPMLAFGDAKYQGPAGPEGSNKKPSAPAAA
jgi:hypothetical protein